LKYSKLLFKARLCHPDCSEGSHEILRAKALRMTVCELFITMTKTLFIERHISYIEMTYNGG